MRKQQAMLAMANGSAMRRASWAKNKRMVMVMSHTVEPSKLRERYALFGVKKPITIEAHYDCIDENHNVTCGYVFTLADENATDWCYADRSVEAELVKQNTINKLKTNKEPEEPEEVEEVEPDVEKAKAMLKEAEAIMEEVKAEQKANAMQAKEVKAMKEAVKAAEPEEEVVKETKKEKPARRRKKG